VIDDLIQMYHDELSLTLGALSGPTCWL